MDKALRRHLSRKKALRKRKICRKHYGFEYYDNLHQYSKNKIHCSCPMCARKTNKNSIEHGWKVADRRSIDRMDDSAAYEGD